MSYTVDRYRYQKGPARMIASVERQFPICTLCQWFGLSRSSEWVATSPSRTTHYLCTIHREAYGHKYTQVIPLTAQLLADLTGSDNPLRKGPR